MTGDRPRLRSAINVGLLTAYVALVPVLGFFVASAVYLFAHMTYLGIRPLYLSGLTVAGVLAFLYAVFERLLGVLVPHGMIY